MTTGFPHLLAEIRRVGNPARRHHRGEPTPFALACGLEPPAGWDARMIEASLNLRLPSDLHDLWDLTGGIRLFVDEEYGQWGLVIWASEVALQRTLAEIDARPNEYRPGDVVIGEFLGDGDLLLVRCATSESAFGTVVVAQPIDPRSEWDVVATSLGRFVERYLEVEGDKYWQ